MDKLDRVWPLIYIALLAGGCGPKTPETVNISLTMKVGKPPKILSQGFGYETEGTVPSPKPSIAAPIKGCEQRYIRLQMRKVAVAFSLQKDKMHIDRLWADLDGNSKYDVYEEATNTGPLSSHPNIDYIEFKTMQKVRGRALPVMMVAEGCKGLGFVQNSYLQGKTTIDGKEIRFKLYDTDFDGQYGTHTDFGTDRIEYRMDKKVFNADPSSFLALGYGLYYRPFVSEDGKTLTLIKYTSKLGRIGTSRGNIVCLGMFGKQDQFDAVSKDKSVSVPEGDYSLVEATLNMQGRDRADYLVSYRSEGGKYLKVRNSEAIFLPFDETPTLKVEALCQRGLVTIAATLNDSNGWHVTSISSAPGSAPASAIPEPEVEIVNPRGDIVARGAMNPVWQARCFRWVTPKSVVRGTYTATVKWRTGAFGVLGAETKFIL